MTVSVLVVDDERVARDGLARMVANIPGHDVVATAATAREAVELCASLRPNVMLLDIEMPEHDGFAVLRALPVDDHPVVVLVTAFDEYALDAFEFDVHDYVLKPVHPPRLAQALATAAARHEERRLATLGRQVQSLTGGPTSSATRAPASLVVREAGRTRVVPLSTVDAIEAEGYYARIHSGSASFLLRESLGSLENRLPRSFRRVHRSTIVQLGCIRELRNRRGRGVVATLSTGREVEVSRRYLPALRAALYRLGGDAGAPAQAPL